MPQVRIETRNHWLNGRYEALYDAIQAAMVEGIKIPEDDRCYRLVTYDADHFPIVRSTHRLHLSGGVSVASPDLTDLDPRRFRGGWRILRGDAV